MVLMTPQLAKIVWNGARTTGNPVYPQGGLVTKYLRITKITNDHESVR